MSNTSKIPDPLPYLDPLNQTFVDELATQPPPQDLTVAQFRAGQDKSQKDTPPSGVVRTSLSFPHEGEDVKVFIFKPKGATGILPVVFYYHGGGWISGSVHTHDAICRDLALQTGFAIVFPEYTLAPEAKFPVQNEQCYATVKYVAEHGHEHDLSTSKFAVAGDSAGGQLATAVTILCTTRRPNIPILYQVLLSPFTSFLTLGNERLTHSEWRFFNGPVVNIPFGHEVANLYIPDPEDWKSELASSRQISPEHAKRQPPTLIVNSSVDPLHDDGLLFGQILQEAGVDCSIVTMHGQVHDSAVIQAVRGGPTPRTTVELASLKIRLALGGSVEGKWTGHGGGDEVVNGKGKRLRTH